MPLFGPSYLASPKSAALYVLSVMLFPTDDQKRWDFSRAMGAGVVHELIKRSDRQRVPTKHALFLAEAPRLIDVIPDQKDREIILGTELAGFVLGFILKAAESGHPELASRGAALDAAAKRRGRTTKTTHAAWEKFGAVSHLWLAHLLIGGDAGWEQCVADHGKLLLFLSAAENLRRHGEAFIPLRARESILDPNVTWKVPDTFPLPRVEEVSLAHLLIKEMQQKNTDTD